MKHYKDPETNEIYAYELDGSQDEYILDILVPITDDEATEIRTAKQQARIDSLSYQDKRRMAYPPITDYIDAVVKNDKQQMQDYINSCIEVKLKYPKE
jgi:hypothetical protein